MSAAKLRRQKRRRIRCWNGKIVTRTTPRWRLMVSRRLFSEHAKTWVFAGQKGHIRGDHLTKFTPGRRSQRSSDRLDPSHGCRCCKEHRKKVRVIRPRQSEAEQGDQGNYGEVPYFGVQSSPPICRGLRLALSRMSISRPQIKVTADEVRSFLPYLGETRNDAPSAL